MDDKLSKRLSEVDDKRRALILKLITGAVFAVPAAMTFGVGSARAGVFSGCEHSGGAEGDIIGQYGVYSGNTFVNEYPEYSDYNNRDAHLTVQNNNPHCSNLIHRLP